MSIISNCLQITAIQESGNRYWEGGAFCRTCGYLQGNVINDTIHSIYHIRCRPDCQEVWESQGEYQTNVIQYPIETYIENKIKYIVPYPMTKEEELWYQEELVQDLYEASTGYLPSNSAAEEYERQRCENESMMLEEERKRQEDREWDELAIEEAIQEEEEWKQRELLREAYESEWTYYDEDYH